MHGCLACDKYRDQINTWKSGIEFEFLDVHGIAAGSILSRE